MSSPAASIIYVGMDVHKDSITIAVVPMAAKNPTRLERLPNDSPKLKRYLDRLVRDGQLRVCYEGSGAGYVLHRALREWGYACDVTAPSLIPKRPGVQRKHDKHDAADLARYYRAGELTPVRIALSEERGGAVGTWSATTLLIRDGDWYGHTPDDLPVRLQATGGARTIRSANTRISVDSKEP